MTIGPFTVTAACGPTSTSITVPASATIPQHNSAAGMSAAAIPVTIPKSEFTSSNPACPLTDYSLASNAYAGITSNQDGVNVLILLSRDSTTSSHLGSLTYDLVATADGGATGTLSSSFLVYHYCYAIA